MNSKSLTSLNTQLQGSCLIVVNHSTITCETCSNLFEVTEYETNIGVVHHFEGYYYDPVNIKMYKQKKYGLREICRNNSYFILRNSNKKNTSVSWLKLDHMYLRNQKRTNWFDKYSK